MTSSMRCQLVWCDEIIWGLGGMEDGELGGHVEKLMELIVDLMLPTQGHFSICIQVDDQLKTRFHHCLHAATSPFPTWYQSTMILLEPM